MKVFKTVGLFGVCFKNQPCSGGPALYPEGLLNECKERDACVCFPCVQREPPASFSEGRRRMGSIFSFSSC